MNNDADAQLAALFRAVRSETASAGSAHEFAFATRVMARVREDRGSSIFSWAWRLAPFFAAVALAAGIWSRTPAARTDAEANLLAEAARSGEERWFFAYMTGKSE